MNVVMDDAEEVWVKQSRKPANDDSDDSKANGAQTSKTKKQYGDRRTLGESLREHLLRARGGFQLIALFLSLSHCRPSAAQGREHVSRRMHAVLILSF